MFTPPIRYRHKLTRDEHLTAIKTAAGQYLLGCTMVVFDLLVPFSVERFRFYFLPIIIMFALLYFLMIRPQMKRAKEAKAMVEALQKGDEVVTSGGLVGRITKLGEQYLTLEIAPNTEIVVQRSAVQVPLPKGTIKSIQ